MTPQKVVEECLEALGKKIFIIPGFKNRLACFLLSRILPRRVSLWIMNRQVGKLYRE